MSENLDLVERSIEAFNRRDTSALSSSVDARSGSQSGSHRACVILRRLMSDESTTPDLVDDRLVQSNTQGITPGAVDRLTPLAR